MSATRRGDVAAASIRYGTAACVTCTRAATLSAIIRSHSSTVACSAVPRSMMPALLTRTSRRPRRSRACWTASAARSGSVMSASMTRDDPPSASMSPASSSSRGRRRATMPTVAPSRASRRAVAAPMPLLAPVTSATAPAMGLSVIASTPRARPALPTPHTLPSPAARHARDGHWLSGHQGPTPAESLDTCGCGRHGCTKGGDVMATLLSVNVGRPKDVAWQGRTVYTGVWKRPVEGSRLVQRLNIDGDGQGDLAGHGGEQRAVLVYQIESYRYWQDHFGWDDFQFGQFGDNFTVDGLSDDEVCIGDRYRIGEAEVEVTQPRVTCFRLGLRLEQPELPALLVAHHRPGFYLRVIDEGHVQAGDEVVRTRVGRHRMSVAEIDALLYLPGRDAQRLRAAVDLSALSPGWVQSFRELLDSSGAEAAAPAVGVEPAWAGFHRLRVERLVPESATILSVYLAAADD